jgi:hypothetical protein
VHETDARAGEDAAAHSSALKFIHGKPSSVTHPSKHRTLAALRRGQRPVRIQTVRIFRKAGNECSLGIAQIRQRLAEVIIGGGCDADVQVPEIHAAQVLLENPLLAPKLLQANSGDCFDEFGAKGAAARVSNLHQLLRDC